MKSIEEIICEHKINIETQEKVTNEVSCEIQKVLGKLQKQDFIRKWTPINKTKFEFIKNDAIFCIKINDNEYRDITEILLSNKFKCISIPYVLNSESHLNDFIIKLMDFSYKLS